MAIRRPYKKNRPARKRRATVYTKKKRAALIPRALKYRVYRFKRDIENNLLLSGTTPPEGWVAVDSYNAITTTLGYAIGTLGNAHEFIGDPTAPGNGLFKQYRLLGVRVRFYASNTVASQDAPGEHSNCQLILRMSANQSGKIAPNSLDAAYWQQVQKKKYYTLLNGGKCIDIYMPLQQIRETVSSTGTAGGMSKPRFINTDTPNVVHYGANVSIGRMDGQALTQGFSNAQYVKMIQTVYFEMRGVE